MNGKEILLGLKYVGEDLIDEAENGKNPVLDDKTKTMLKIAFSRGEYLERAYLDDGTPKVIEKRFNNHTGIKIGAVRSVKDFGKDGRKACRH